MLLIFLLPLPTALIFSQLLPSRHSGSSFIEIFLYNLVGVSIFSFLIRNVLKAIQPTWIVFQGDTITVSQSLWYQPKNDHVEKFQISDIHICISDKALGDYKKPIITFGKFDTYLYLKNTSSKALFQTNDNRQYIKLATYDDRTKARQSAEYLNHLLGIQKANITNLQESNINQNIEEDFTTPLRTQIGR
jgi:hypothetical protein